MLPARVLHTFHVWLAYLKAQVAEWAQRNGQARVNHVLHKLCILKAAYAMVDALHT
jgi:hypothetical protein